MNISELIRKPAETKSSRVIAPLPGNRALVCTPNGVRTVSNAASQTLRAGHGVIISGNDNNTIIGIDGMRETPKTVRIRG